MSEVKVNKISPRSGTAFTLGDSGDTFTVPSGATLTTTNATVNLPASVGGLGTGITNAQLAGSIDVTTKITGVVPTANLGSGSASSSVFLAGDSTWIAAGGGVDTIWELTKDGDQASIATNTATKVTDWTAVTDTGSAWDNTNSKIVIPAEKGGKYLISAMITQTQTGGNNSQNDTYDMSIYKNGSYLLTNHDKSRVGLDFSTNQISMIADLSAADYLEIYVKFTAGAGTITVLEFSSFQTSNICTNWLGARLAS